MPRWRSPYRILLVVIVAALLAAMTAYVVLGAWLQASSAPYLRVQDLIVPRLIDLTIITWLAVAGTSLGSFLNVVAWRMPRGETVHGRSRCPRCQSQLRARDNVPVFGWLALGGRCHTCRLPIAVRYPLVELGVGVSVTLIGTSELYRWALPFQPATVARSPLAAPTINHLVLITALYHVVGITFCWACGLIRYDAHRLPAKLVALAIMAVTIPMVGVPALMCVPWQLSVPADWRPDGRYLDAIARLITAFVAAAVFGRALVRAFCPQADPKLNPLGSDTKRLLDLIWLLTIPAVLVGWQALPAVLVVASWLSLVLPRIGLPGQDALGRFAIALPVVTTLQIVCWRTLQDWAFWPGVDSPPYLLLAAGGLVLLIPLWLHERPGTSENLTDRPPPNFAPDVESKMIDYQTYMVGSNEDVLVMQLSGRLDEHTSSFLLDALTGWVEDGTKQIILDCSDLEQITSFGLAALVRLHARLRKVGGDVKLTGVRGTVADVLRVVRFEKLFNLYPSVDEAVVSFA